MKYLFIILFLILNVNVYSQENDIDKFYCNDTVDITNGSILERAPYINIDKLNSYIVYPKHLKDTKIEGKVIVKLQVSKEGKIRKKIIEYSDNKSFEKVVLEALDNYGKVIPAIQNNQPVDSWLSVPIVFELNEDEKKKIENETFIDTLKLKALKEKVIKEFTNDSAYFKILIIEDKDFKIDNYLKNNVADNKIQLDTIKLIELLNSEFKNSLAFRALVDGFVSIKFELKNGKVNNPNFIENFSFNENYSGSILLARLVYNIFNDSTNKVLKTTNQTNNINIDLDLLFFITVKGKRSQTNICPPGIMQETKLKKENE